MKMSIFNKGDKGKLSGSFGKKYDGVEAAMAMGDTAALVRFLNEQKPSKKGGRLVAKEQPVLFQ